MNAAFEQGQRDREQGWPAMADRWGFTAPAALAAYQEGYDQPRTGPAAPFNTEPAGWREVTEKEFAQSIYFHYSPDRVEHRQFLIEWNGRATYHSVNLHRYWNQTGAAIVNEFWDGKVRFFLFGCDHRMKSAPGNQLVCEVCGFGHTRPDSSD